MTQFNSVDILTSLKAHLDAQKQADPGRCYWHDEDVSQSAEKAIQVRAEGLHAFLAHPDSLFDHFTEADLQEELATFYRLIVEEKRGFVAPCYAFHADLCRKRIEPPEFIDTVGLCLRTVSGVTLALSSRKALSPLLRQHMSEIVLLALEWFNSSWTEGGPQQDGQNQGIGWGGFRTPGEISVYATHSAIAALPAVRRIRSLLDGRGKKASYDFEEHIEKAARWLRAFGAVQVGHWAAGEWEWAEEANIYNVYGLSALALLMQHLPKHQVEGTLQDEEYITFLRTLIRSILVFCEQNPEHFAASQKIDVGTAVKGKWVALSYEDCSIVPMALYAISCMGQHEHLSRVLSTAPPGHGGRKEEPVYEMMNRVAKQMYNHLSAHNWDRNRRLVVKPVSANQGRFCIYMTDRVVRALAAYQAWVKTESTPGPARPRVVTVPEVLALQDQLDCLQRKLETDLRQLRSSIETASEMMKKVYDTVEKHLDAIPRKVVELLEKERPSDS